MPTLDRSNFNIVVTFLGGFISLFGLVSYLLKENFYMSEALISMLFGVAFSPHGANLIRPVDYALGDEKYVSQITLAFSRLVLGVQLVLAGIQLPSRYLKRQWKSLAILLGPVMTCMWLITSLLIWGLVPNLPFLHALAIGACVTPTDPILSNVIVKGKFADHNVPKELQEIIIAESGANDGLGYPFLFIALYLIKYLGSSDHPSPETGGAGLAIGLWFGETWGYIVLLSVVYGAAVGWIAKQSLHYAEGRKWVDRESFLVFAFSLALFIVGSCGMIGSDDVLACFVAGNVFTWDDWFRLETLDESFPSRLSGRAILVHDVHEPRDDMLTELAHFNPRLTCFLTLVPLGILVLLLRRPIPILLFRKQIGKLSDARQTAFMGFFGPVGVSGIFYLIVTLEFLDTLKEGDEQRADVADMGETVTVVVWFIAICSVVIHGLSIPLGQLGFYLPRTISRTMTLDQDEPRAPFRYRVAQMFRSMRSFSQSQNSTGPGTPDPSRPDAVPRIFRIGGLNIRGSTTNNAAANSSRTFVPSSRFEGTENVAVPRHLQLGPQSASLPNRPIQFRDETPN